MQNILALTKYGYLEDYEQCQVKTFDILKLLGAYPEIVITRNKTAADVLKYLSGVDLDAAHVITQHSSKILYTLVQIWYELVIRTYATLSRQSQGKYPSATRIDIIGNIGATDSAPIYTGGPAIIDDSYIESLAGVFPINFVKLIRNIKDTNSLYNIEVLRRMCLNEV